MKLLYVSKVYEMGTNNTYNSACVIIKTSELPLSVPYKVIDKRRHGMFTKDELKDTESLLLLKEVDYLKHQPIK